MEYSSYCPIGLKIELIPVEITIDDTVNSAYVRFCDGRVHHTVEIPSKRAIILTDYGQYGNMLGIEIIGFDDVRKILKEIGIDPK